MDYFPARYAATEKDRYEGPTKTGRWASHIPELTLFRGIIDGVEGVFWKGRQAIEEARGQRMWEYWRQLGLWVEGYNTV